MHGVHARTVVASLLDCQYLKVYCGVNIPSFIVENEGLLWCKHLQFYCGEMKVYCGVNIPLSSSSIHGKFTPFVILADMYTRFWKLLKPSFVAFLQMTDSTK